MKVDRQLRLTLAGLAAVWGFVPLMLLIAKAAVYLLTPGFGGLQQSYALSVNDMTYTGSTIFWGWVFVCALLSLFVILGAQSTSSKATRLTPAVAALVASTLAVVGFGFAVHQSWQNSKNVARFYDRAAVVYTPSIANAPGSLQFLLQGAKKTQNGCWVANSDVPSCVKVGTLPLAGFEPRVSSATGAAIVMQRTSGSRQNVNLLTDANGQPSLTYLNGAGKSGVWSGIRDGFGAFQPTEGVVEWTGNTALPTECKFGGRDAFNKAINGVKSNSLVNFLTRLHPSLYWNQSDVWGYCDAQNHPVLVFPVQRQVHYLSETVSTAAGVLVVKGSPSGTPQVTYLAHATNLPGPTYPASLVDQQLNSLNWMAGRGHHDRHQFGFEPTTAAAQQGNVQNYLLKSASDGHVYWVTPLTLSASQSQLFVAYAMVRADQVNSGHLNTLRVYALASNDPRVTSVDQLESTGLSMLAGYGPSATFTSNHGQLVEFTPAKNGDYQAFGEVDGRVIYRLTIPGDASRNPTLVTLDAQTGAPTSSVELQASSQGGYVASGESSGSSNATGTGSPSPAGNRLAYCGDPVTSLTNAQVLACAKFFVDRAN